MLKRVAVLSKCDDLYDNLAKAAEGADVQLIRAKSLEDLPASAAGVIAAAGADEAAAVLGLGVGVAERYDELLFLLADAIDCHRGIAPGSSARVMEHATRFAQALGLDAEEQSVLERSALVRSIGLLKVSHDILFKKSLLNYDEWAELHAHPELGARTLETTTGLRDTAEVVRTFHECYDGTGYPGELEREAIPRMGRIMRIVDVYCAMTSPRVYRESMSTHEEAIEHLRAERGKHFDPELVDVFIEKEVGRT